MAIKGDFISFTYNGVHSTDLGVMRVTSSNRYTDALLPTIQDKTVQAPGSNGTYFFGSYYTQRQITINVAFDEVTEDQIRLMRKAFGDQLSHELIFDDEPYKVYYAKATGTPQLQYIPFSSPRVYKGEGTFSFTCYDPFAHTPNQYKYLTSYQGIFLTSQSFKQGSTSSGQPNNSEFQIITKNYLPSNSASTRINGSTYILNSNLPCYAIGYYNASNNFVASSGWKDSGTSFTIPSYSAGSDNEITKYQVILGKTKGTSEIKITPNDCSYVEIKNISRPYWYHYNNNSEWNLSANLLESKGTGDIAYDTYISSSNSFKLYNPGDVETDFKLIVPSGNLTNLTAINISNNYDLQSFTLALDMNKFHKKNNNDNYLCFNSKMNLIEGMKLLDGEYVRNGTVYNECIQSGSWFKIPLNDPNKEWRFYLTNYTGLLATLQYDYLYL